MTEARLKSSLWVAAQVRLCSRLGIPATVARHGDDDAGQILVKLNRLDRGCSVHVMGRGGPDGRRRWHAATGEEPVDEQTCDAYIAREIGRDPDLWVLEIEDREGRRPFEEAMPFL
jgi:hypothetical protein